MFKLSLVAQVCNNNIQEVEAGRMQIQSQPGLPSSSASNIKKKIDGTLVLSHKADMGAGQMAQWLRMLATLQTAQVWF